MAFELIARGSRASEDVLAGSTAAFVLRLVVLSIPLLLVAARIVPLARTPPQPADG